MFQKPLQREEASAVIVGGADKKCVSEIMVQVVKKLYCIQETAVATSNIMLIACSTGLGICWISAFKEVK